MTDELKKIIFSPQISNIFREHNWIIIIDSNSKFYAYFVGEIADYYLYFYNDKDKIHLQFILDIEIPNNKLGELMVLINTANQHLKDGFFVFDSKYCKIKYNLLSPYPLKTEETYLQDFLKINLDLINNLFHNLVYGIHNLVYGEKIESASLELLFMNNKGCA